MNNMMRFLAFMGQLLFFVCYLPQVIKTYRTKEAKDLSFLMYILCIMAYCCMIIYSIHLKDLILLLGYGGGFICSALLVIGILLYK